MACFQILLALKFPFGKAAWGGKFTILPWGLRLASLISALVIVFVLLNVLERAGIITVFNNRSLVTWVVWIFTVFLGLNTLANLRSPSRTERRFMTPLAFILCILCLIVSITAE
jgi:hypothetical protein